MKPYIEHNGHKVVLSIGLETKSACGNWQSGMFTGQATDIHSLIDEIDKAKEMYADIIKGGASIVVDVQDYTPEVEGCHGL